MPGVPVRLTASAVAAGSLADDTALGDVETVWPDIEPSPRPEGPPPGPQDRPLDGVRIIDLATFLAAPFASTLCAAHGADVVKVEAPTGDPYAVFNAPYACVNEHKPRLSLDLREPEGRRRSSSWWPGPMSWSTTSWHRVGRGWASATRTSKRPTRA